MKEITNKNNSLFMRTVARLILPLLILVFCPVQGFAREAKYVGVKTCKVCHKKKKLGRVSQLWEKSGHAKAYKTLLTDKAREEAKRAGVTESPEKAYACLVCHVTAPEADKSRFGKKYKIDEGVGCESCHGAGSLYRKNKIMKKLSKEYQQGGNTLAKKYGYSHGSEDTCTDRCHRPEVVINGVTYKNFSYEPFDVKEAMQKIAHPLPK